MTKHQPGWWQSFYDDTPFELYMARNDKVELEQSIAFLRSRLQLQPGAVIFDQCCGLGGLSIPLAEEGYRLIGADLCQKYIVMARAAAKASGKIAPGTTDFFVGDAFEYIPGTACDGAFNWYTSFGYSPEDAQNRLMIDNAFQALKPGARYALDFLNMPMIRAAFKEVMTTVLKSPEGDIVQSRRCRMEGPLMQQHWNWVMPGGRTIVQDSTLRAYEPEDLVRLFREVGFTELELFGSCANGGEALTATSGRCIIVGRKPA